MADEPFYSATVVKSPVNETFPMLVTTSWDVHSCEHPKHRQLIFFPGMPKPTVTEVMCPTAPH